MDWMLVFSLPPEVISRLPPERPIHPGDFDHLHFEVPPAETEDDIVVGTMDFDVFDPCSSL
jgi:hypothetical protein